MAIKLTQAEAYELIDMLKRAAKGEVLDFPAVKGKLCFDVFGDSKTNAFVVNIDRKGINAKGCTYQGRVKENNIILLRLDVNPTAIHINPSNKEKIIGTHLHVYNEEYGINEAVRFDVNNKNLFEICYLFFKRFNIIRPPEENPQQTLQDWEER